MSEWIEWKGGECPVTGDVDVRFRTGREVLGRAEDMWWNHNFSSGSHSGGGDIVAYRIVEPEAHMMSAPITVRPQGVQVDTVTISMDEYVQLMARPRDRQMQDCVVSDLCEQVRTAEAERDALRAEVERLNDELERLRKGKDDEQKCDRSHMVGEARPDFPKHRQAPSLAMVADTLDPRLGTPQPDGEPCEPMSARRWRWLP